MAFGHFLLGSHNLMVTALGSCVKWLSQAFPRQYQRQCNKFQQRIANIQQHKPPNVKRVAKVYNTYLTPYKDHCHVYIAEVQGFVVAR